MDCENFVKKQLIDWGFKVNKIKETNEKRPDFYMSVDDETYIIEVKEKEDSNENKKKLNNSNDEELQEFRIELIESGSISRIIKKAQKQINTYTQKEDVFRIIWFICTGVHASSQEEVIKQSIYDSVPLWDLDNKLFEKTIPTCYFFGDRSKFFKYRNELDGVIVGNKIEGKLCLNPFSPRYDKLKKSNLLKKFNKGYIDPENEEKLGRGIIVDDDIDRSKQKLVLSFLNKKYNTRFKPFPMTYYSALVKQNNFKDIH